MSKEGLKGVIPVVVYALCCAGWVVVAVGILSSLADSLAERECVDTSDGGGVLPMYCNILDLREETRRCFWYRAGSGGDPRAKLCMQERVDGRLREILRELGMTQEELMRYAPYRSPNTTYRRYFVSRLSEAAERCEYRRDWNPHRRRYRNDRYLFQLCLWEKLQGLRPTEKD